MNIHSYLRLARPLDWLKNGFVPLGLLFGEAWHDHGLLIDVALVTLAFCMAASAVYACNDVSDVEADRNHSRKRTRPVASGAIAPSAAFGFGAALAVASLLLAASVGWRAAIIIALYLALNAAYSVLLRRLAYVDVAAIAAGFMLRVLAGTVGVGIPPSSWLLATTLALTLFLAFAKRRAESLSPTTDAARPALAAYGPRLLDGLMLCAAASAGSLYVGFTIDRASIDWHAAPNLWLTAPPALAVLARYAWLVLYRGKGENPARDLIGDPWIAGLALLWLALIFATIGGVV